MQKVNWKCIQPHAIAILVFLLITLVFFSPVFFENKILIQPDIQQFQGASKSLSDYRLQTGEEGLWASHMFSGMPAYLVSLRWSDSPLVWAKKIMSFFLPHPVNSIFLGFLSYYILLLVFGVRPYLAIAGALAFGLSSYIIIGISAGHNARIGAIAFAPLVMAGIHLAFSNKRLLGLGVTTMALALHLRENHLQITYYLILIIGIYGVVQLIHGIQSKKIVDFFKTGLLLILAVVLAVGTFFGQFWAITEYTSYSIRGASELENPISDRDKKDMQGLSREYAFAYKYGVWESMTLMIPNFYGGTSRMLFAEDENSASYKALVNSGDNEKANQLAYYTSAYWGPQGSTVGAYYAGSIIIFLFVLGVLVAEKKYVWWLVPVSALGLMLSWGDNFSTFNYFMFDYFPGYNKFRSVSFALIMPLLAMPLLAMMGLEKFVVSDGSADDKRKIIIAFISTGGICILLLVSAGIGSFLKEGEAQLPTWFTNALATDRKSLLRGDAFRALLLIGTVCVTLYFNLFKKISPTVFYVFIVAIIALDLVTVDRRYFTKNNFQAKRDNSFLANTPADEAILKDKEYYRVYNLQNTMAEARSSYNHYSIGGYHGAKLRRYQDLYDSCLLPETERLIQDAKTGQLNWNTYSILNMLNAKYIVYGPEVENIIPNPIANGAAWFVKKVEEVNSPTEELKKVSTINTKWISVIDRSKFKIGDFSYDSLATIRLIENTPPYMKYETQSSVKGLAVFSEIFYPKGWHAYVDQKEVPIIRANYLLRALEVPAGKHHIEFKFQPKPYTVGNKITHTTSWVVLLMLLGCLAGSLKN